MCSLTALPSSFALLVPNVRTLNLNFNFLDSIEPIAGMERLRKLSVVGARLGKCRGVIQVLTTLPELKSVDLRSVLPPSSLHGEY